MWKIEKRAIEKELVLFLSGRIQGEELALVEKTLLAESGNQPFVLDLAGLKLVDQGVVLFLANCEKNGTRLRNCPAYIREWMKSNGCASSPDHDD